MAEETSEPTKIIRKKTGNFLEDFKPGQIFRHKGGKTVTEGLFALFTDFSMGTNPLSKNARYARARAYPIIPCNLCGSQENLQRAAIKQMLAKWESEHPGRADVMFRAMANVSPSQLADRALFDFEALERGAGATPPGDDPLLDPDPGETRP